MSAFTSLMRSKPLDSFRTGERSGLAFGSKVHRRSAPRVDPARRNATLSHRLWIRERCRAGGCRPGTLVQQWRVLQACVDARKIVIMQAANTGLTGGSTPDGDAYDGAVVLVNTMRITGVRPIDGGRQVVCLPGATLHQLEKVLRPLGREPHSVIGSSCLGASVAGGICNNSGVPLFDVGLHSLSWRFSLGWRRRQLRLVNDLGIALGAVARRGPQSARSLGFRREDIERDCGWASDREYIEHIREDRLGYTCTVQCRPPPPL